MTAPALTEDRFLGGRLRLYQPARGVRAGSDAVLLAAAVAANAGQSALDVGCGVGPAALCLARRVAGIMVTGLEIQPALAELARRNAALNRLDDRITIVTGRAVRTAATKYRLMESPVSFGLADHAREK